MRENKDFDVIPLKVSQASAVQVFDQKLAAQLEQTGNDKPMQPVYVLSNDSTNACAFLSLKIVDRILTELGIEGQVFANIADVTEETIWFLPEKINAYHNLNKMQDGMEA